MSDRRLLLALLCSLLILSAGCTSLTGDDADPTTSEPFTTAGQASNGTTAPELAPGLTADGVTDAAALADAHQAMLEGEPFVMHASWNRTNATATASKHATFYTANKSHWYSTATGDGLPVDINILNGTVELYTAGDVVLKRTQANGNVSYRVIEVAPNGMFPGSVYNHDFVYGLFDAADVTIEEHSGATTRVSGTADKLPLGEQPATNVEFTATVTETGRIQSLDVTYQQGSATVERSLTFEKRMKTPSSDPTGTRRH